MFPIQHPQNKDTSVTRTIPQARHLWIKTFPALFTDVMSYITMSVVIIVPLTFHNMHTMNYVSYKYSGVAETMEMAVCMLVRETV